MRKLMLGILLAVLTLSFSGCSGEEAQLTERSVDGVAAYLGYTDGETVTDLYKDEEMAAAKDAKYFRDGKVTIYEFDPQSSSYKDLTEEIGTCADGFVIIYDNDIFEDMTDYEIIEYIEDIQSIQFKDK